MHELTPVEKELKDVARRLNKQYGAPVVIIVAGDTLANIDRTMVASSFEHGAGRLRDLLGILQTAIQMESWKHLRPRRLRS